MSIPPPSSNDQTGRREPLQPPESAARDAWSLRVATVSGIPIRLHFTFLLLVTWFALAGLGRGGAGLVFFLLGIFLCVALHELGHSLVAQRYGYKVRDIVLYPIGGVASIEGSPRPRHELWIALAGPAVNVVIALLLYAYLAATGRPPAFGQMASVEVLRGSEAASLLRANILLVLFNMIPAFPMDGGRVLRAVLALRIGRAQATRIAALVGQGLAILFGIYGFLNGNFFLMLIALFVFFGAGQEATAEQSRSAAEGAPVGAAMVRQFQTLNIGDSLRRAAEVLLATHQQDFPITHGEEVVGVLSRGALLRGLAERGESTYVSEVMTRDVLFAKPADPLEEMLTRADGVQRAPVLVMEDGRLVGMLTVENLMEYLTLRQIAQTRAEQARSGV
jgi:Zn-dependent protease